MNLHVHLTEMPITIWATLVRGKEDVKRSCANFMNSISGRPRVTVGGARGRCFGVGQKERGRCRVDSAGAELYRCCAGPVCGTSRANSDNRGANVDGGERQLTKGVMSAVSEGSGGRLADVVSTLLSTLLSTVDCEGLGGVRGWLEWHSSSRRN